METFVQPKITGYRQLSEAEAALMNIIKAKADEIGAMVAVLRCTTGLDQRWVDLGTDDLQKGFMSLIRSVAKPDSF